MLDGRRKSIQPMAERLPDGNEQNLQQFVNQSTWDPVPVRRRIAERMVPLIGPDARAVDDMSFPKDGRMSMAVAHQYCGALGKQANCQVAASVHAVSDTAPCPLQWRLFVPQEWAHDAGRRQKTGLPPEAGHRERWRLALDTIDELARSGLVPPVAEAAGSRPEADSLVVHEERSTPEISARLGSARKVPARRRRYLLDGKPVEFAASYLPLDIDRGTPIAEPNPGPDGSYARLEELGHRLDHFDEEVRARMPAPDEVKTLRLASGVPVIHLVVRTAYGVRHGGASGGGLRHGDGR